VGVKAAPVLVVVPGESYEWGAASLYDASLLATRGRFLVVTFNYRLGILGEKLTNIGPDIGREMNSQY
jgi:carboxylesterase type B